MDLYADTMHQAIVEIAEAPTHLDALAGLRGLAAVTRATTDTTVLRARADGASWEEIGAQLGISKQAAQQRYGGLRPMDAYR